MFYHNSKALTWRFDVAHLLHIPAESPALEAILEEIPFDMDWNTDNAIERGYKKAQLKRYDLVKIGTIMKEMNVQTNREVVSSATDSKNSKQAFGPIGRPPKPTIKVENQPYIDLTNKAKVLKSAKGHCFICFWEDNIFIFLICNTCRSFGEGPGNNFRFACFLGRPQ